MVRSAAIVLALLFTLVCPEGTLASQDKYQLPEPYLGWEKASLKEFPDLQKLMDLMIQTTVAQLKDPEADILHNRVCAGLAYEMAKGLSTNARRLAVATDIFHNIAKEDAKAVLTDPEVLRQTAGMIGELKGAGYFKGSPQLWADEGVIKNPKVGANRGLIHHLTGALQAGQMARQVGGFTDQEIREMQAAIVEHSTGYWYFRDSVDVAAGKKEAWRIVYPEPASDISRIAHDADLISQFVPESVVPDGSKWRELAKKRWGAKSVQEEGHVVYYVFWRLFEEAKTDRGKALAREKWEQIRPELFKLMGLATDQDPVKVLGVPKAFQY